MNLNVRLVLRKLLLGAACMLLLDLSIGGFHRFVFFRQRSGKFYRIKRSMAGANQRLLVFGSSHAASHYVPEVLEKELGTSAYNAGVLGQQILFHKTLESIILHRFTPEVIILDVDPSTLYESAEAYARLGDLKPFYVLYPQLIGPVLDYRSSLEWLFLRSKLYQYNSTLAHVIRYGVSPQPDWNGYRPEYGVMSSPTPHEEREEIATRKRYGANRGLDSTMVHALELFALDAFHRNVRVFYFVSPGALPYDLDSNKSFDKILSIVRRLNIPFYNFRNHSQFLRHYDLFYDSGHLNDEGARRYSKLVADAIKEHMAKVTF